MSEKRSRQVMLAGLQKSCAYPDLDIHSIHTLETHSAWIILTGEFVFKIKKPVNFGFLDFSTLEKRRFFCEQEVILNQRYAPNTYFSMVEVRGSFEHPVIYDTGHVDKLPIIEYAVKMRQFPGSLLLSDLAASGKICSTHIDELVKLVAEYHQTARTVEDDSDYGSPSQVKWWALESYDHIAKYMKADDDKETLNKIHAWAIEKSSELHDCFKQRKANGRIRDCHGDLHLDNLTVIDGKITAFDCIEFNNELRWIDVINEVAFLMMDLTEKGYPEYANRFLNKYLQSTGDYEGLGVLDYYLVYRATVRAKVAILRCQQLSRESIEYEREFAEYKRYLALAEKYTRYRPPKLIITFGMSGSGKSFVAERICEALGFCQIRSDIERKRRAGIPFDEHCHSDLDSGLYSKAETATTYGRLIALAEQVMTSGYTPILDATFIKKTYRTQALCLAIEKGIQLIILHCEVPETILQRRILARAKKGSDTSDANLAVLNLQQAQCHSLSEEERQMTIKIDTGKEGYLGELLTSLGK